MLLTPAQTAQKILENHGYLVIINSDGSCSVCDPLDGIDGYYLTGNDFQSIVKEAAADMLGILVS